MGILDDVMADDATFAFTDTDTFAEAMTYYPQGDTDEGRDIKGGIMRHPPRKIDEARQSMGNLIQITVANSNTLGISASELDLGKDKIGFAEVVGGESVAVYRMVELVSQDAGCLVLTVR